MPALATIGVYGFSAETFLAALRDGDVRQLLDVRQRRGVRGSEYAWANSRRLQYREDERRGVGKRSRAELAPVYVDIYTREILDRADLEPVVAGLPAAGAGALFCVERDPEACHRSLVAERLEAVYGLTPVHLRPPQK